MKAGIAKDVATIALLIDTPAILGFILSYVILIEWMYLVGIFFFIVFAMFAWVIFLSTEQVNKEHLASTLFLAIFSQFHVYC
jgi:Kef-type K+ transport system membrane component KefB